ncbi:MAG: aminopeptidase N [Halioglobus sp.]|jgi:aminopeptidase N
MMQRLSAVTKVVVSTIAAGLLGGCGSPALIVEPGVSQQLAQFRSSLISDINYRLALDVPAQAGEAIAGHIVISLKLADAESALQLDFRESADNIKTVRSNGHASAYSFDNEHIVIPSSELKAGHNEIEVSFVAGAGSLNRNPEYLYTLFVPDRARTAFPLFDQPDLKATYELTLGVPEGWVALSNAPVAALETIAGRTQYRFQKSDLISSYLFSFVAGKFDTITRKRNGRSMTMLHRETNATKLQRNLDAIFDLHADSIDWLETYTGIPYPYQKFDFALIPTFQYGGMEHVGAIQYRASSLLLDESPSQMKLLSRASLIAHETAHMWFGDLVTMQWFDDVWTKEVFANFMAAKIVNPGFPDIDHDLNFLVRHYPSAYSVDRTAGANAIRQQLDNLNEAGQMYGDIIYNKAPIMMRQLEALIGEDKFREGLQEYLQTYAFGNATWPDLVSILDNKSAQNLRAWSDVWVNTSGRPQFERVDDNKTDGYTLVQVDASGGKRIWPQQFEVSMHTAGKVYTNTVLSTNTNTPIANNRVGAVSHWLFNADGFGYGQFPAALANLEIWDQLSEVEKGSELINLYEQFLAGSGAEVEPYFAALQKIVGSEKNQLTLNLALHQVHRIYWSFTTAEGRLQRAAKLEPLLWQSMLDESLSSRKKIYFDAFADIALSPGAMQKVYEVWSAESKIDKLKLSENDRIDLAQNLAIKMPGRADDIISTQIANTDNPDSQRKLRFLAPSVSSSKAERDRFFTSLALAENRQIESWVLEALQNLHHPLRVAGSQQYLLPSLELLQEIQVTGDIFFPKSWLDATLQNYNSTSAVRTVTRFLEERPNYNKQLRMKILQSGDMMIRANRQLERASLPDTW